MRNLLKLIPVALLALILLAGCSKTAPQSPNTNVAPPVRVDPAIMRGASNTTLRFLNSSLGWAAVNFEAGQTPHGIIIHTSDGGATWVKLNAPGVATIRDLAFTDAMHGWVLTETNADSNKTRIAIMATGDGGQTWAQQWQQELQQSGLSYREQFFNASEGFVLVGDSFLATVDGGATWVQRGAGQSLDSFSFSDRLTGWATGSNSIWHTADGGVTWVKQWTVPDQIKGEFVYSAGVVSFVSPTSGWALFQGNASTQQTAKLVLYTDDGGSHWSVSSAFGLSDQNNFSDAPHYTMARFVPLSATTTLLAASPPTDYPVLYRTADHGVNWETLSDGMSSKPGLPKGAWGDLSFTSDSEGWAAVITQAKDQAGSNNPDNTVALLHTQDGGKTWTSRFP